MSLLDGYTLMKELGHGDDQLAFLEDVRELMIGKANPERLLVFDLKGVQKLITYIKELNRGS